MGARGTVSFVPLVFLLVLFVSSVNSRAAGAQQRSDQVLPGCGICYPGGYDINTVGDVDGTIIDLRAPAEGPVRIMVAGERERWVVLASPIWFWRSAGLRPVRGDSVTVRGSKTLGADGTLYLIAREIRPRGSAPVVVLRDRRGVPLWSEIRRGIIRKAGGADR